MIIVHLGRDREGEDTHQNIVHETVLSFGRLGHLIHFTHNNSLIANNLNPHSLKSYANSNQNSMLASFFSYCFFNSPPLELVPWMIELYFLQLITWLFYTWFQIQLEKSSQNIEEYEVGDYKLIQYQTLWTSTIGIVQ